MSFGIIEVLLVGVVGFIGGIDQFSFLECLYRPIILGPIVGAILGNAELGLKIGASYELVMIGSMPIGGAQPPNAVLGGIMAVVFAIALNSPNFESALGLALPFGLLGQQAVNLWFTISSPVMSVCDRYAEEANTKGIVRVNMLLMCGIGLLFAVLAMVGTWSGYELGMWLSEVLPDWVWTGLGAAGGMMRFIGFAVLMKVMISGEFWIYLFAGFVAATLIDAAFNSGAYTLVIMAVLGATIAFYDFNINTKLKAAGAAAKEDYSDGI